MRRLLSVTLTGMATVPFAGPALAADLNVKVEIPRLNVAEYHKPYVAMWVERADQGPVQTLAVWYDGKLKENEGTKWLKDMRQWWRKAGRDLNMPADGISGATRAPGEHTVSFRDGKNPLGKLPAGDYQHSATDVYANVVNGFRVPWVTAVYVVAQLAVGLHLFHGIRSVLQSLGVNSGREGGKAQRWAAGAALALSVGNIAIPVSVLVGLVG